MLNISNRRARILLRDRPESSVTNVGFIVGHYSRRSRKRCFTGAIDEHSMPLRCGGMALRCENVDTDAHARVRNPQRIAHVRHVALQLDRLAELA